MTPTEQDNELRDKISSLLADDYACNRVWEAWQVGTMAEDDFIPLSETERVDEFMKLITADRKRVALEARLNEVQNAYEHWINGRSFISSYFRDRIALLSNTKESKDE